MPKYRKKPVMIEAYQWKEHSYAHTLGELLEWPDWLFDATQKPHGEPGAMHYSSEHDTTFIQTLEGEHRVSIGDFIIRGVQGELYPCKPDIFEETYEAIS